MRSPALLALTLAVLLAGCAPPELQPYVGPNAVRVGTGATLQVVNGMEVWKNGTPPRRYRILGVIEEEGGSRSTNGTVMADLVRGARQAGASALIVMEAGRNLAGVNLETGYFVGRATAKAVAIRYE